MRLVTSLAALSLFVAWAASAQEDTTPPVLLDFTIAPVVFDTGPGAVTLDWCFTVADDLSGLGRVTLTLVKNDGSSSVANPSVNLSGELDATDCGTASIAQFTAYDTYRVFVQVWDAVDNFGSWGKVGPGSGPDHLDLCPIGPCELVNRPSAGLPDADGDGIPDDADNCPADANAGQEDTDLDLLGDVCDPFPFGRDNEQAQCEADLVQCQDDLAACVNPATDCRDGIDNDGDRKIDFPADPGCTSLDDSTELAPPRECGLGIELALVLPALAAARRRWRPDRATRE